MSSNRPNEISLAKFPIEKAPDNEQPLKALSSESIKSGESKQIAEKIESVQRAVRTLRTNKEGLAEGVTRVVTDVIGVSVSQPVEDEAKGFVDDLIATLEDQAHRTAATEVTTKESTQTKDGQYVIRLTQDGEEIHRVVGNQQAETMASLVDYFIDEEGLTDAIEIPYVPGTGQGSRALLNDKPEHTNGAKMRLYEPLSGGYYLFTSSSAKDKMRYLPELLEKVGLECEFAGEW